VREGEENEEQSHKKEELPGPQSEKTVRGGRTMAKLYPIQRPRQPRGHIGTSMVWL